MEVRAFRRMEIAQFTPNCRSVAHTTESSVIRVYVPTRGPKWGPLACQFLPRRGASARRSAPDFPQLQGVGALHFISGSRKHHYEYVNQGSAASVTVGWFDSHDPDPAVVDSATPE